MFPVIPGVLLAGVIGWALAAAALPVRAQSTAARSEALQVRLWAASCMACHGTEGRAEGAALALAGRPADRLAGMLLAFKNGERTETIMHQHAKGYSDSELRRIAEYFARVRP